MPRVKGGFTTRRRHKKIKLATKGYYGANHRLHKRASDAMWHAGEYAFAGRRQKRRDLRRLWIVRINAALQPHEIKYSRFIKMLKDKGVVTDRKILADLIITDMKAFEAIVEKVKS